ncbi:MAG: PhzF family phenazine biosynthesis isomerase [Gammaproteobacteria bacterium]|nr:PhzF family phenazine biosynthesis isomerase [Gammaproteobacteria bacterium]
MPRSIKIVQVDAFTQTLFTGNPAGVVLGAGVLRDEEMLAIARELNNGDTAFVLPADGDDHDVRVRFFTPRTESSFVGHATIAAQYVLSEVQGSARRLRQRQRAGIVDVEIRGNGSDRQIAVRQPAPVLGRELNGREKLAVLDALALSSADLDPRCAMRLVSSAGNRLLIGVRGAKQLRQLKPDLNRLTTLSAQLGASGHFVFTLESDIEGCLTQSRMFCPVLGIPEDPVSGNAHGLLGAYLLHHGLLTRSSSCTHFSGAQGQFMNRPGRVDVDLEFDGDTLAGVWIIGSAAIVFETTLTLPLP